MVKQNLRTVMKQYYGDEQGEDIAARSIARAERRARLFPSQTKEYEDSASWSYISDSRPERGCRYSRILILRLHDFWHGVGDERYPSYYIVLKAWHG